MVQRITQGGQPDITISALVIMVSTFPMNAFIAYLENRAGIRLNSEILIADAVHTRTDLYITASVVVSMFVVWRGWVWLDFIVATIVIFQIVRAAFGILGDAAGSLADNVGVIPDIVDNIAQSVPGVLYVHRIRSRGTSQAVFVDLHIKVDPSMSTSHAHAIASEVEQKLIKNIPEVVDALVHIEPAMIDTPSEWERIANDLRRIADGMGLGLHDLHVHIENGDKYSIELHLEMDRDIYLGEAHAIADEFEKRVKDRWPEVATLITHLEPLPDQVLQQNQILAEESINNIRSFLIELIGENNLLEIQIRHIEEHASLGARLRLPPDLSLIEAHSRVEEIERLLLSKFPELHRVVVHVEP
ncbi:MAG: cation diffusion facilitator family transporter [Anaerolineales bacterium]